MAIAVDKADLGGSTADGAPGTDVAFTTTQTVASNGFIVVWIGFYEDPANNPQVTGVSGGGLTWIEDLDAQVTTTYKHIACYSAQAPSGLASSTTITATFNVAVVVAAIGGTSFTGVATSSPVDTTDAPQQHASTTAWTTDSTTLAAGSVLTAGCFNESTSDTSTPTSPSIEGWEAINGGSAFGMTTAYRIEGSGGSYTVAGTWAASVTSGSAGVAYKAAATGTIKAGSGIAGA